MSVQGVRLFVNINDVAAHILNQPLVIAVVDSWRHPRECLPNRSFLVGLRFC